MNAFADLVLLGWLPAMLVVFALLPVRTALLIAGIGGWLLLPQTSFQLTGLPNYEKSTAISLAMLFGSLCFDPGGLRVRVTWWDLPMTGWIASAFLSALANDTGLYDATASLAYRSVDWGVPYVIGRAYFASPRHVRTLLWGIFAGGLFYVVPCLWEIRMSPQLHHIVYGSHQHSWLQALRGDGYRPLVFTPHGLALSLWMAVATMAGVSLWRQRAATQLLGLPMWLVVAGLGGTMVLCKSFGATILLVVGVGILLAPLGRWMHAAILVIVPLYLAMRLTGAGGLYELLSQWASMLPVERGISLQFRLDNEALLIDRGWDRPLLGWTPWSFLDPVTDAWGDQRLLVCDSMWIINFVCNGLLGLGSMVTLLLLPGAKAVLARVNHRGLVDSDDFTTLGVIVTMFQIDSLVNSFMAPIYMVVTGALVGASMTKIAGATEHGTLRAATAAAPAPAVARRGREPLRPRWQPGRDTP